MRREGIRSYRARLRVISAAHRQEPFSRRVLEGPDYNPTQASGDQHALSVALIPAIQGDVPRDQGARLNNRAAKEHEER